MSDRVRAVLKAVLFTDEEFPAGEDVPTDAVRAEGVVNHYAFHPVRLAESRAEISTMLAELPDEFWSTRGGGWSFLNACMDRHGSHWAEHQTIEQLVALGIASGMAAYLFPRAMWPMMPGGMPYFSVTPDEAIPAAQIPPLGTEQAQRREVSPSNPKEKQ